MPARGVRPPYDLARVVGAEGRAVAPPSVPKSFTPLATSTLAQGTVHTKACASPVPILDDPTIVFSSPKNAAPIALAAPELPPSVPKIFMLSDVSLC